MKKKKRKIIKHVNTRTFSPEKDTDKMIQMLYRIIYEIDSPPTNDKRRPQKGKMLCRECMFYEAG